MVICDTNVISKYLEDVPDVIRNIDIIGIKNVVQYSCVYL